MILETTVKKENKTINEIISNEFHFSNRLFSTLIKNKLVIVNNQNVDTRNIAQIGDNIMINLDYPEDNSNIVAKEMKLEIVYEDEGLLVINKPAGISIHPSILHYEDSLANGVKYYFDLKGIKKKIRPVNRLDLNTSGLVIFAKNEYIQESLIRQMQNNVFTKEYLAIVEGTFENKKGTIDKAISRKENSIIERCVSDQGQRAITQYEVLQQSKENSLVTCRLITGRTHQIRVHMAYIGHPLLGDTLYGNASKYITRQALHSYKLSFMHPITKKELELICELPEDFLSVVKNQIEDK